MDKIYVYEQVDYNVEEIKEKIKYIFEDSGFSEKLIPGKSVFLKVNLLRAAKVERCVTTNPKFVRAVAEILIDKGLKVIIGDSPAGPFTPIWLKTIYIDSGLLDEFKDLDVEFNYNTEVTMIKNEEAYRLKDFEVFQALLDSDLIINLPKLKTHTMMRYTGAVKNMFGAIAGLTKANYHFRLQKGEEFGHHLIDIIETVKPDFNLMDGIMGMEGDGPSSGDPISSNIIIGGENPYALDKVAIDYISFPENYVYTVKSSRERGLFDEIEIIGDRLDPIEFKKPKGTQITFLPGWLPESVQEFFIKHLKAKIIFNHEKCIKCRHCSRSCPVSIIEFNEKGYPYYNFDKCISCFCCHEVCPVDAIDVKNPIISRLMRR